MAVPLFYVPSEGRHQGFQVMVIVELIKIMIMSVNIESLVEQGVNVKIEVTAADLKMFGEGIAERAIMAYRQEIESKKPQEETYCNTREVRELLNVCDGTLNLWAKRGYLVPVKVGNKNMYAMSDVRRIKTGGRNDTVTNYCKRKEA